jgi:hypothetical protein
VLPEMRREATYQEKGRNLYRGLRQTQDLALSLNLNVLRVKHEQ